VCVIPTFTLTHATVPVCAYVSVLVTPVVLLSGIARFGVERLLAVERDRPGVQRSGVDRGEVLDLQAPAPGRVLAVEAVRACAAAVAIENVVVTLSVEPPVWLCRIADVPSGPISVTTRSPLYVCVIVVPTETEDTVRLSAR
jgi:hypothetical protein